MCLPVYFYFFRIFPAGRRQILMVGRIKNYTWKIIETGTIITRHKLLCRYFQKVGSNAVWYQKYLSESDWKSWKIAGCKITGTGCILYISPTESTQRIEYAPYSCLLILINFSERVSFFRHIHLAGNIKCIQMRIIIVTNQCLIAEIISIDGNIRQMRTSLSAFLQFLFYQLIVRKENIVFAGWVFSPFGK